MNQENKIQGIWWLSDHPEQQVSGELFIDERKLELNGSLEGIKSFANIGSSPRFINVQQVRTILGITKKGNKKYTLEFFNEPSILMSMPGYQSDTYHLGDIYENGHLLSTEKLSFSRFYLELPYLFEWVNQSIVSTQIDWDENKKTIKEVTVKIGSIKEMEIYRNTDYVISCIVQPHNFPLVPSKEMAVSQICYIKVESLD